jgi:hypothetical protein
MNGSLAVLLACVCVCVTAAVPTGHSSLAFASVQNMSWACFFPEMKCALVPGGDFTNEEVCQKICTPAQVNPTHYGNPASCKSDELVYGWGANHPATSCNPKCNGSVSDCPADKPAGVKATIACPMESVICTLTCTSDADCGDPGSYCGDEFDASHTDDGLCMYPKMTTPTPVSPPPRVTAAVPTGNGSLAFASGCDGKSVNLPLQECAAWLDLWDGTRGQDWHICSWLPVNSRFRQQPRPLAAGCTVVAPIRPTVERAMLPSPLLALLNTHY